MANAQNPWKPSAPFELNGYSAVYGGVDGWKIFGSNGEKMVTGMLRSHQDARSYIMGQGFKGIS